MRCVDAEVVASYSGGGLDGLPAITRRALAAGGAAWYLSVDLDGPSLVAFVARVITEAGVAPVASVSPGMEAVRRASNRSSYLFLINHTNADGWADVPGTDLLTGVAHAGRVEVPAGAVAVVRENSRMRTQNEPQ